MTALIDITDAELIPAPTPAAQFLENDRLYIVATSDTHTMGRRLHRSTLGDVFVHAGDLSFKGGYAEVYKELEWVDAQPEKYKIVVPGNHDWVFDPNRPEFFRGWRLFAPGMSREAMQELIVSLRDDFPGITFLIDQAVTIQGVKFYGSPWQPYFWQWAFNFPRGNREVARETWAKIPDDTNVLITHGPPEGIRDGVDSFHRTGCPDLRSRVDELKDLRLHIFGHIHEGYGTQMVGDKLFINAAACNKEYEPVNNPIVVRYDIQEAP
jgi:predicted phosphodiesterase